MAGMSPDAGMKLLLSGENSDFTIKCQDVEFKVHQLVIKANSDFFRVICDRPFKVSIDKVYKCDCLTDTTFRSTKKHV